MTPISPIFSRIIVIILILKSSLAFSQLTNDPAILRSDYIPVDSLIEHYELNKSISFYYNSAWFQDKKLHKSALNLPTGEFISRLLSVYKFSVLYLDSTNIVLTETNAINNTTADNNKNDVIYIGNSLDYGRYTKAKVTGKIADGKTGIPLPGVFISCEQAKVSGISDAQGNYSIELPVGKEYNLSLTYMGFEELNRRVKLFSNGKLDLELFEKSLNINEVVVSAEKTDQNISRTQMSVIKLDAKMIKELPVTMGEIDVIKSVSLLPGIQSTGDFGTGFFVRGGGSDQNLILIESVPIFNASHIFGLMSILNPDAVKNVTMLKAGIPAKFGERASSVMDIKMGSTNRDNAIVKGGIGFINSRLNVDLPLAHDKINLLIGGRSTYSDWLLKKMPDPELMKSSASFYDLNGLLTISLNAKNNISLFGYYSNDDFSFNDVSKYNYTNTLASFRWNHIFSQNVSSVFTTGLSHYTYNVEEQDTLLPAQAFKTKASLLYKNAKYNISWIPSHTHALDIGVNAVHYAIHPGDISPYNNASDIQSVNVQKESAFEFGIYASDNMNITDKLSTEIGLRYSVYMLNGPGKEYSYDENYTRSIETVTDSTFYKKGQVIKQYAGFEPRFSMRYGISNKVSVKLSYSKNIQYINLFSNSTVMSPSDVWKLSNKYVKPLQSEQYAIGYFRNFKNNTYETSIELYYKKLKNVIEYKNGAKIYLNPQLETEVVNAEGKNFGVELYVKKALGTLTGWISYSFSVSRRRTTSANKLEQINNNQYFPSSFDSPHNLNIIGNYHISRRWRFSWLFTYSTGRPVTLPEYKYDFNGNQLIYYSERNKYRIPDYHRLDISITFDESLKIKKFWKGSWSLSIINVYGRDNAYSVFLRNDSRILNRSRVYTLRKLYLIGVPLPTLTYNFSF